MSHPAAMAPATAGSARPLRYDPVTILLHWLTALLTFVLFAMTLWWEHAPRAINLRFELEDLHVSLGLLLTAVIVVRLLWRVLGAAPLAPAGHGAQELASRLVHWLLYVLTVAQIGLGFVLRWLQGDELSFFGLFSLPTLLERSRPTAEIFEKLHDLNGWAIVILATGHAGMALVHHYWLRDAVLRRMLPGGR